MVVVVELCWVLQSLYRVTPSELLDLIDDLLRSRHLQLEHRPAVQAAVQAQVCRQPTSCRSPAKADELTLSPLGLIARIYEVFPLPEKVGPDSEPPHIASARGPPLWEDCKAQVGEGAALQPD